MRFDVFTSVFLRFPLHSDEYLFILTIPIKIKIFQH